MSRRLRILRLLGGVILAPALVTLSTSSLAHAAFGPATLLSGIPELPGIPHLQFSEADAPALAREGGYVVFQGSLAGIGGVYRRDLESGAVESVAVAEPADPTIGAPDASAPSVSANGQYVAFTTTADLEPEHPSPGGGPPEGEPAADAGCPEVYVRNMDLPANAPGAYTLASALNGSGEGITFTGSCKAPASGQGFAIAGAQAAPAVALSADGQIVAFTVLSLSNLADGVGGPTTTPPSQVAVRDLATDTTTLVSVTPEGAPTPGGGAYPSEQAERHLSVSTSVETQIGQDEITDSTAAISADGSTVAWLGTDVSAQVPGLAAEEIEKETYHEAEDQPAASEVEPLWRRIADGSGAFTRRLMAGAGLDLFYSPKQPNEIVTAGSLVGTLAMPLFIPPALSEDGEVVALIANAPRPAAVRSAELITEGKIPTTDAYSVHVNDDPSAPVQVTSLTETPDYDTTADAVGYIDNIAISPSGDRVAFDAQRTQFTLPSLALVSPPVSYTADGETYEADLTLGTLQRVSVTYDGAQPTAAAGLLSFSADERELTFASQATNLFYGDAVKGWEVYTSEELSNTIPPAFEQVGPTPEEALPRDEWRLDATAYAQSDGSVVVYAHAPGAGTLTVAARAQLPASGIDGRTQSARRSRSSSKVRKSAVGAGVGMLTRTVGKAAKRTAAAAELRVVVSARSAYSALVAGRRGLYAVLRVSFSAAGHKTVVVEIPVTFRRTGRAGVSHKKSSPAKASAGKQRAGRQTHRRKAS